MASVLVMAVGGVFLDRQFGGVASLVTLLVSTAWLAILALLKRGRLGRDPASVQKGAVHRYFIPLLVLISALFGFYAKSHRERAEFRQEAWSQYSASIGESLTSIHWRPVVLKGTVEEAVRYRRALSLLGHQTEEPGTGRPGTEDWQSLTVLHVQEIRTGATWRSISATIPISISEQVTNLLPGDKVEVYCQWKLPAPSGNPGQFDMASRYADLGYAAQARADAAYQIRDLGEPNYFRADRQFAWVGRVALQAMQRHIPLGQFELAAALILGQRDMVEWRLQEDLLATGSIHMLSISGMHIEMISTALLLLGTVFWLPRRWLFLSICILIWCYTMICGSNPPVMRASIMLTAATIAKSFAWQSSSMNNLSTAGFLITASRPTVVFELGTQLSFLAVAVLILSSGRILKRRDALVTLINARRSKFRRLMKAAAIGCIEIVRTSFWVWFITAPLVWTGFHVISPIAIIMNLILWIPMLIALVVGLGMILVGWIPPVGAILGYLCGAMLWLVDGSVDLGESVPYGHFWSSAPPFWWMVSFYLIAVALCAYSGMRGRRGRRLLLNTLLAWYLFGILLVPALDWIRKSHNRGESLAVTILDVGHGCHVWIELPSGEFWCYDAGRMGDHERSYRSMVDALWQNHVLSIDTMILSHGDSDHYNAMPGIADRFRIKRFVTTPEIAVHSDPILKQATDRVVSRSLSHEIWRAGHREEHAGCVISVLHPQAETMGRTDNANSLCLLLEFAGKRILLPGDLEPPGTDVVTSGAKIQVDMLLAPHHGSLHSRGDQLADWCSPQHVVVSGATRSLTDKVEQLYAADGRKIWYTPRDRAMRFVWNRSGELMIQVWRGKEWVAFDAAQDRWTSASTKFQDR